MVLHSEYNFGTPDTSNIPQHDWRFISPIYHTDPTDPAVRNHPDKMLLLLAKP